MTEPSFDREIADRWFAVECNNRAWDLVEKADRTPEETGEMIHTAHTSLWHWQRVGTQVNRLRALTLLATAYLAAGEREAAVRYADQCIELSDQLGDEQSPFDRVMAYGCAASVHWPRIPSFHEEAELLAANLTDDEERAVYDRLYRPRCQP